MNNQAAQTMPTVPQAAGVPDVLFDGYAVYQGMTDEARARINAGGVSDVLDSVVRLIRAQAAPSASGGESAASLSSNPNPVTPSLSSESAVSVSERARELLAAEYDNEGVHGLAESIRAGTFTTHLDQCSINAITNALASAPDGFALVPVEPTEAMKDAGDYSKWNYDDAADIYKAMLRAAGYAARGTKEPVFALEQALTQQRGEATECVCPAGSGCTRPCDRGWRRILSEARALPPSSRDNILDFIEREMEQATTTPQPSADAVRELVATWRKRAARKRFVGLKNEALLDEAHADELESLLSGGSHA